MAQENRHQTCGKGNSFRNAARLTDNIRACLQCADCQGREHCQEKQDEMQKGKFFDHSMNYYIPSQTKRPL